MAKVKVEVGRALTDGMSIKFKAPCNCVEVDGLTVSYLDHNDSEYTVKHVDFTFRDTLGNDLTGIGNLFASGAIVNAVLDTKNRYAYLQNVEGRLLPVGSIHITSTNKNPGETFGGTWELIDKEFASFYGSLTKVETDVPNKFAMGFKASVDNFVESETVAIREGHTLRIRQKFTVNTSTGLDATNVEIGTFNMSLLGVSTFRYNFNGICNSCDEAGSIIGWNLLSDGKLYFRQSVGGVGANLATGTPLYFDVNILCPSDKMSDEVCNKFYWKRVM